MNESIDAMASSRQQFSFFLFLFLLSCLNLFFSSSFLLLLFWSPWLDTAFTTAFHSECPAEKKKKKKIEIQIDFNKRRRRRTSQV